MHCGLKMHVLPPPTPAPSLCTRRFRGRYRTGLRLTRRSLNPHRAQTPDLVISEADATLRRKRKREQKDQGTTKARTERAKIAAIAKRSGGGDCSGSTASHQRPPRKDEAGRATHVVARRGSRRTTFDVSFDFCPHRRAADPATVITQQRRCCGCLVVVLVDRPRAWRHHHPTTAPLDTAIHDHL